jgi:glycosyltransferase involved in cell wall biosynthesis
VSAPPRPRWCAVVFARNEAAGIGACLRALARAGHGAELEVCVVLNGSTDASAAVAAEALRETRQRGRIWSIAEGDKANAINQFIHHLRPPAETCFFVDAYAAVAPDALAWLHAALAANPGAQAAAALPTRGLSARRLRRAMRRQPGLHGSLFALRGGFLDRMAAQGLRLPLGFYRGDGLIGSLVLHDLDAMGGGWREERLVLEPRATWRVTPGRPWRLADLQRHWRRLIQQGRARLQWPAVRAAIYPGGFTALPDDADAHVLRWVAQTAQAPRLWRDPFAAMALARMRGAPPRQDLTPRLLLEWEA